MVMGFALFSFGETQSSEAGFWAWFEKNEAKLFEFERNQEVAFGKLKAEMAKVHPDLTFEFGPVEEGRREFVISADGLRDAFPAVESLHASAPHLSRWTFVKFRPRRLPMAVHLGYLQLEPSDVEVAVEADGDKAGFTVFVRGYNDARRKEFAQAAFLMLDQAIGEYDMETKVGFIEVKSFEQESSYQRHSLEKLSKMFDEFMKR